MPETFLDKTVVLDVAIIGDGIAGALLALTMKGLGYNVALFSDPKSPGSSTLAAGQINPITGRHFVKSWKIDNLLDIANRLYSKLEVQYGAKIQYPLSVIRALGSPGMINEWSARTHDPLYADYIDERPRRIPSGLQKTAMAYACIQQAQRIDFGKIRFLAKKVFSEDGYYFAEKLDPQKIVQSKSCLAYKALKFKRIVFCEGAAARHNPLWSDLEFVPAKGERIIIEAPELLLKDVYNDGKIIIPIGNDQYWVGSNYEWKDLNLEPTNKMYAELTGFLEKTLNVPYQIVDHSANIRPSSYNRRPFVGEHPTRSHHFILNGLGAKGASLAPFCVEQLIAHIFQGKELDPEIDVNRVEFG